MNETITLTFSDSNQHYLGIGHYGVCVDKGDGFKLEDLILAMKKFEKLGIKTEFYNLNELCNDTLDEAYVLVIRDLVGTFVEDKITLWNELTSFNWDNKYYGNRRKNVLNKQTRSNVCFDRHSQIADSENRKRTIISYETVPVLDVLRKKIIGVIGEKDKNMVCEGNRYFADKCGICFHGGSERRRVIGISLGKSMPIHWCWYQKCKAIGNKLEIILNDGDMYIMSEKAVGTDWEKKNITTLRHTSGRI